MKTQQEHIEAEGNHCPFCDSDEIEGGSIDVDNGRVYQPMWCLKCGKGWEDEYTLSNYFIENTDDDDTDGGDTDDDAATTEALAKGYF